MSLPSAARRAQLVLLAAAVVAVALVPVVFAYLQLGAHPDVEASGESDGPTADAVRVIDRAVHEAGTSVAGTYPWRQRDAAVSTTRLRLDPRLDRLEADAVAAGIVHRTSYNRTAARRWAAANCPRGPDRQFGACEARQGIVVQERTGDTHVLAVALDLTTTTDRGTTDLTLVVRTVGGA